MTRSSQIIDIPCVREPSAEAAERFRQFVRRSEHRWAVRKAKRARALPRRKVNSWTSRRMVCSETPILLNA